MQGREVVCSQHWTATDRPGKFQVVHSSTPLLVRGPHPAVPAAGFLVSIRQLVGRRARTCRGLTWEQASSVLEWSARDASAGPFRPALRPARGATVAAR